MTDMATTPSATPGTHAQSSTDLDTIGAELAGTMPEVQEHAIRQAEAEARQVVENPVDKSGRPWNPEIHAAGADGRGVLTARGTWAMRRGRKAGNIAPARENPVSQMGGNDPKSLATPPDQDIQSRMAGVAAAEMLFMTGVIIGGDEWQPEKNEKIGLDERAMMHDAFGNYFVATGKKDVPPGAALTLAIVVYAARRLAMPRTQSRVQWLRAKIGKWWLDRRARHERKEIVAEDER